MKPPSAAIVRATRVPLRAWASRDSEVRIVPGGAGAQQSGYAPSCTLLGRGGIRDRNRSGAYALSLANGATLSGMLFLLTLFLQNILGFSPLRAGLAFLPTAAGVVVGAGLTSRLIGRSGPRLPMAVGALLSAVGLFWLSRVTVSASYVSDVLGPLVVLAIGLGQIFVSTSIVAVEAWGALIRPPWKRDRGE